MGNLVTPVATHPQSLGFLFTESDIEDPIFNMEKPDLLTTKWCQLIPHSTPKPPATR